MKNQHIAKLLEPIQDPTNLVTIGEGAKIILHKASPAVILSLREKFIQNPKSLLITHKAIGFLFSFDGCAKRDASFYRA